MALPMLDLREFRGDSRGRFVDRLREAAHDVGFFHLVGHGVPDAQVARTFALAREFFALPEEEKLAIRMSNSPHFRGYTQLGGELTGGRIDRREQIDIGLEVPALHLQPNDPPWRRLQGPNQWPARPPGLRQAMLDWHRSLQPVAIDLLRAFALSLHQPESVFDEC